VIVVVKTDKSYLSVYHTYDNLQYTQSWMTLSKLNLLSTV